MKKLMLTNEAVARGAWEAGVKVVSSYPGTPSTEITEFCAGYPEMYVEWAPNEKVSAEVAIGAAAAGVRSMCCMKHVGVNVAADPLFTAAYTGVNGGMVLVVADDPAMHSSQNEQDSRFYARSAHVPMLEPADSAEAKEYLKRAFDLSEEYDTPVMLRLTTRSAHSQSYVELADRVEREPKPFVKDIKKWVMMPAAARGRHLVVEKRERELKDKELPEFYKIERRSDKTGIVTLGAVYQYVKEATDASVFKVGLVYPLPVEAIRRFAETVEELIVCEELEPFIENQLKAAGIECRGKDIFGLQGEFSPAFIREKLYGIKAPAPVSDVPGRPPVMCAGCPHRGVFYVLNKLKLNVCGDIGCYTLGANPPLSAVDICVCMGASVGMAHGFDKADSPLKRKTVAVIGDSTFIHSGITNIINAVYNKGTSTTIILDNSITGMTGHQDNPSTGKRITGEATAKLDLEKLCEAIGVQSVRVVDAYDLEAVEKVVREETAREAVSVIIARRPCALLTKSYPPAYSIDPDKCVKCRACLRIGCPAIEFIGGKVRINKELCVGCGVCKGLCRFGAIKEGR